MKTLIALMMLSCALSISAAELTCSVENNAYKCQDLYDVFMADQVCFEGEVADATHFHKLVLRPTRGIKFLEGQITSPDKMLIFVEESGVEQLRYIERCL